MPLNCPLGATMICQECRYLFHWDGIDKCNVFFPARPLNEILTLEEKMETYTLEAEGQPKTTVVIHRSAAKEAQELNQVKGQILFLQKKLNEHIDKAKKLSVERRSKY